MKFLDKSRSARDREAAEKEKERAERERLLQEKNRLLEQQTRQQKKKVRQARIFMAVLATVLLLAIAAGIFAGYQWRHAKLNADTAEKNAKEANYNLAKVFEESDNFCLYGLFKPAFANMIGRTPQITQIK